MRSAILFFTTLAFLSTASSQEKYLVSPTNDVFPLSRGQSAETIIARKSGRDLTGTKSACPSSFIFGFTPDSYPPNVTYSLSRGDIIGQWFIVPAWGSIDTLYWVTEGIVGTPESTLYVQIHASNIGPTFGPGIRPGPYPPPCQTWGYWIDTFDVEYGISPFGEGSTDTQWVSTIQSVPTPTTPPFRDLLWGFSGVPVRNHPGQVNKLPLQTFGPNWNQVRGDQIFVSWRSSGSPEGIANPTQFLAEGLGTDGSQFDTTNPDPSHLYPSRVWKFYYHNGYASCGGSYGASTRGWVAKGGLSNDSLDVSLLNVWYSMTVTSNATPEIGDFTVIHTTLDPSAKVIDATLLDCDQASPSRAGVALATIRWSINGVSQTELTMNPAGGDVWEGTIPWSSAGSNIVYQIHAVDSEGLSSESRTVSYSVVTLGNTYVYVDTSVTCQPFSISSSGTLLDTSMFYLPPGAAAGANKLDDGTAGPIDMGFDMPLFGDDARYAWIGINGGIALSKNSTDTVDVNANGAFVSWSLPQTDIRHGGRSDPYGANKIPGNFIAPLWADFYYGDSARQCGRILYGNAGDTCLFIVQWDSIGKFDLFDRVCDNTQFRVCLNRCDGTIEYQWDDLRRFEPYGPGSGFEDFDEVVGLQADSTSITVLDPSISKQEPYVEINHNSYPVDTRPRSGRCMKLYQAVLTVAHAGWNMLSYGVQPVGGDSSRHSLYPTAFGDCFYYTPGAGYSLVSCCLQPTAGYWMKFNQDQIIGTRGVLLNNLVINTQSGSKWNLVGMIGERLHVSSVKQTGTAVISSFFPFGAHGYYAADIPGPDNPAPGYLIPGLAYWVKTNGAGTLTLSRSSPNVPKAGVTDRMNLSAMSRISVTDRRGRSQTLYLGEENLVKEPPESFELPPQAPGFDVRYSSGRMLETYPAKLGEKTPYEYPINITADAESYPLSVEWNIVKSNGGTPSGRELVLTTPDGKSLGNMVMAGSGVVRIRDANVKNLVVSLRDGAALPRAFSLGQNYPNPFNPTTRFEVAIPKSSDVEIVVYDLLGRNVATLLRGLQPAGYSTVEWDGKDTHGLGAPTGIYFVRMSAEEFSATVKVLLLK